MLHDLSAAGKRAKVRSVVGIAAVVALSVLTVVPVAQVSAETPCDIVEFAGVIGALPDSGLIGDWEISGVVVHVSAEAEIIDQGPIEIGAEAVVRGCADGEAVSALSIKVLAGEERCDGVRLEGVIEALPDGLLGEWTVSGFTVVVTATTVIRPSNQAPEVGDPVVVEGCAGEGVVEAQFIKLLPVEEPCDPVRLGGVIEALPDGLLGEWQVSGRTILVTEATQIHPDHVVPEIGDEVIVEGCLREGLVVAEFVKVLPGEAPCHQEDYRGEILSLPDGLIGEWQVSGVVVVVTEETEIDDRYGAPAVGRHVYVMGCEAEVTAQFTGMPAVIVARYVKVLPEEVPCEVVEMRGEIEALPADGLIGDWIVGGVVVHVTADTEILSTSDHAPMVGDQVVLRGCADGEAVTALVVKLVAGEPECEEVEFEGEIEALPAEGFQGDWVVSGVVVHVTNATRIHDMGAIEIGARAWVHGCEDGEAVIAKSIKVFPAEEPCEEVELEGAVEALPGDGLVGDWMVAGVVVHVGELTRIAGAEDVAVGVVVEVFGCADGGAVNALRIKARVEDEDETELRGPVESLPAEGLVGDWMVAGVLVHVGPDTVIDQTHGEVAPGVIVEVEGHLLEDGSIQAMKIKVEEDGEGGGGNGHPDATSFAVLHLLPTAVAPEAEGVALTRLFVRENGSQDEDLKVAVEHLLPDTVYDVMVDGVNAGAIHTNGEGEGCLFLSSRDIPGAEPLPSELRPVSELGIVEVVDPASQVVLTGDFANADRRDRIHPGADFVGVALLRNVDGAVVGVAVATVKDDEQELTVKAWNLEPLASYVLVLDASELTALTADGDGMLHAEFNDSPDSDQLLLPGEFLPVSALLHAELQTTAGDVVATGDFGVVAEAVVSTSAGSARRRGGHH